MRAHLGTTGCPACGTTAPIAADPEATASLTLRVPCDRPVCTGAGPPAGATPATGGAAPQSPRAWRPATDQGRPAQEPPDNQESDRAHHHGAILAGKHCPGQSRDPEVALFTLRRRHDARHIRQRLVFDVRIGRLREIENTAPCAPLAGYPGLAIGLASPASWPHAQERLT
jgi:hypothetical protein